MFISSGITDYDIEAHTLDAQKTSAVHQEFTTARHLHGSTLSTSHDSFAKNFQSAHGSEVLLSFTLSI